MCTQKALTENVSDCASDDKKENDRNQDQRADEVWELDKVKFENFRTTWIF